MAVNDRNYRLEQFFGCNFGQDFDVGGAEDWRDVVDIYVATNPRTSSYMIRDDLRSWVADCDEEIRFSLDTRRVYRFDLHGFTDIEFAIAIADRIDSILSES